MWNLFQWIFIKNLIFYLNVNKEKYPCLFLIDIHQSLRKNLLILYTKTE